MKIQSTKILLPFSLILAQAFITGCATSPERSRQLPSLAVNWEEKDQKDPFSGVPERYRLKAREDEIKGDLPKALKAWEIVKTFLPADEEAGKKIPQLNKQILALAEHHFQKGLALFKGHSYASARNEFLLTLYLKPDHGEAILYLKEKIAGEDSIIYEVKKGDTIREVARMIYKDPQKDFLIAYFNGLRINDPIEPPMILKIPLLGDSISGIIIDTKESLQKARTAYKGGNYQESGVIAEKVLEHDPTNRETRELKNSSYYQLGKQLGQGQKYQEALKAFRHVDPGYKDVSTQLAYSQKQLAETHYIKGVKFFIEEDVESAIQEWKATLSIEPNHTKAKKDLENAYTILKKLKKID